MWSVLQFFNNTDKLYEGLEASATEAHKSTQLLAKWLGAPGELYIPGDLAALHKAHEDIYAAIRAELVTTAATELGREDFESLALALFKISKASRKFSERYSLARPHLKGATFTRHAELMTKATENVLAMVKQFRKQEPIVKLKRIHSRLVAIENEADDLMAESVRSLYEEKRNPLRVMVLMDLYEMVAKVINRCSDASDLLIQVALKSE